MVSITIMLVVANVQTNINDSVPKTSYLKMIDYFLIYSFNIIIIVIAYHTYLIAHIAEEFQPTEKEKVRSKNCRTNYP
jgi:heme/copper-type cytochrome/quinol oxidase subunit 2